MENNLVKESDVAVSKKNRIIDDQGVCGGTRKGMSRAGDDVKKRKSGGYAGWSEIGPEVKRSRNGVGDGGASSLLNSDDHCVGIGQKVNGSCGFSLSLDSDGNDVRVPRKRRGSGGIKNRVKKPLSGSSSSVDQIAEFNSDFKKGRGDKQSLSWNGRKFDKVNGGDGSSRKGRSCGNKRKGLESNSVEDEEKAKPAVYQGRCINKYSQGDEENLEQNAAQMLSSRFDPRCTASSRGKTVSSHSGGESGSHTGKLQGGSGCPSADNASRTLRPRYDYKGKGCPRKRRHFYEIVYREKDARWFLKKRIKVFWPLDERWYHGLVNDYDEEKKLHHVKYDDRDKEWICLQNERFMLLLLRSELADVGKPLHSGTDDKLIDKIGKDKMNEVETNSKIHVDSEPIISWLAHSSSRAKSPSGLKKQKTSHSSPIELPQSSRNIGDANKNTNICLAEKETREVCSNQSAHRLADEANGRESMLDQFTNNKENGSPIVYFRRRFRKKTTLSLEVVSNLSSSCIPVDSNGQKSLLSVSDNFQILNEKYVCSHGLAPDKLMWSMGSDGLLKLNPKFVPFKEFITLLSLPVRPPLDFSIVGYEVSCFLRYLLLQESSKVVPTWPNVYLEMLFVDNEVGSRFSVIEGCLKQAVAFISLVLSVFCEPDQPRESVDWRIPVTTIRFKLSCIQDLRKQHIFKFYTYSKLNHSRWLYLDSKFQKRCSFNKKIPLTECTLENIGVLEGRHKHLTSDICESSFQGTKSLKNILPFGLLKAGNRYVRQSLDNDTRHPILPFALSFSTVPSLFRHLHLNLLMKSSIASVRLRECSPASLEHQRNTDKSTIYDQVSEQCSVKIAPKSTSGTSLSQELCFGCIPCSKPQVETNPSTAGVNCDRMISSLHLKNQNSGRTETDVIGESQNSECYNMETERIFTKTKMLTSFNQAPPVISGDSNYHCLHSTTVENPAIDLAKSNVDGEWPGVQTVSSYTSDGVVFSPDTSDPRSLWTSNKRNISSLPLEETSPVLHGGRTNDINSVSSNGRRKARTQVHYALPFGDSEYNSKHKPINLNCHPLKRMRRASENRMPNGFKGSLRNLELLACDANVLITQGDRGWREPGGRVVLELAYRNEWRLAVKFYGSTKYSHKVDHIFLPGSTNRHTHAMMWKGGKDWSLEFPDRSQWMLFKEMHAECYNRNIQVSSVKNIPIPGVRLVEEFEDDTTDHLFTRSSSRYIRQIETDIDMAMNPLKNLYDMDSEDELWILETKKSFQNQDSNVVITDETFEKTMDMLEKFAYAQQCDQFTVDEMEKIMTGVGPADMIRAIYRYWQNKRKRLGMPLIRHLQPPSWERYQQKVQEWNQIMSKSNTMTSCGGKRKAPHVEKPNMFAFCLKPRGLEVPNKVSKHRSQKKYRISGHAVVGDQDRVHTPGRRFNSFAVGDEKATYLDISPENSDNFSMLQTSTKNYLPSDAGSPEYVSLDNDASDFDYYPKPYKHKSKKNGACSLHVRPSYKQRTLGKRNGVQQQNMYIPDWPSQKHHQTNVLPRHEIMELGVQDLDEFAVRKATSAAKRASIIAMLKKNKAQELLSRADFAMQVAVSAIMDADAVKASYGGST